MQSFGQDTYSFDTDIVLLFSRTRRIHGQYLNLYHNRFFNTTSNSLFTSDRTTLSWWQCRKLNKEEKRYWLSQLAAWSKVTNMDSLMWSLSKSTTQGRAIAQAVSRWLPTAAVRGSNPGLVTWDLWWTKWRWGRFSPSTSVSSANLHSNNCSTITLIYHLGLVQ
jgi:hypothetical protein